MKPISEFMRQFGAHVSIRRDMIAKRKNRYFLLNDKLKELITEDFFYAGTYLGKARGSRFFPSFNLLSMIAETKANKVIVDKKTEWLFICGRDIFRRGITKVIGSKRKGDYTLILNLHGECLGFGKIMRNLTLNREGPAVENILDVGDFLRRED
jgi:ribosome biogenesis protein Nip4